MWRCPCAVGSGLWGSLGIVGAGVLLCGFMWMLSCVGLLWLACLMCVVVSCSGMCGVPVGCRWSCFCLRVYVVGCVVYPLFMF